MPLNTLRLNHQASSHPNDRIVFIKPLPRPPTDHASYETADLLLRAIAAQCLPIMKGHYLSVTTLEEHEPNPEFIGRNFNNGEIIQLVLKSNGGNWLPVNFIQMVMMHELAHNVHMNHGKGFWATRNKFADEMRVLWTRGYTGDGLWGTGRSLDDLERHLRGHVVESDQLKDLPLCGGTFRSKGRKRKRKGDDLTWKEKRDRRIEKKFGKNGVALGEDDDKRLRLDMETKGPLGVKPRVAQSKRGRELRAAAALARFGSNKKEVGILETVKSEGGSSDEDESDYDSGTGEDAKDVDGQRLLDSKGNRMVRVCDAQQEDDVDVKQEMNELEDLNYIRHQDSQEHRENRTEPTLESNEPQQADSRAKSSRFLYGIPKHPESPAQLFYEASRPTQPQPDNSLSKSNSKPAPLKHPTLLYPKPDSSPPLNKPVPLIPIKPSSTVDSLPQACPICSMENLPSNPTCLACSHVLDPRKDPRHWRCKSVMCQESLYVNAGDCGVCGICGQRKDEV